MQAFIISGSRNREGQTAKAIEAVRKGLTAGKAKSEAVFLPELKLERCRQCDPDGWGLCRKEGRCIIEDDFASLVEKVKAADVLVFGNPVYFGDLSESMRCFLERYRRTRFMRPGTPPPGAFPSSGGTPAIGICYAGGSGNGTVSCAASLERILQTCGFDVVDMIQVRRQNFEVKLPMLEMTGKWLAGKPTSGPPFRPAPPR
ncbi:MAG: flavodoxin family protein [Dehalococcoidales bacterium]|nr:flavodoxin family protein [Dehalococcoidales bacterium]